MQLEVEAAVGGVQCECGDVVSVVEEQWVAALQRTVHDLLFCPFALCFLAVAVGETMGKWLPAG